MELLTVHHMYINRMANHVPIALDTLGENFNTMSANCDNLNDRLETLEKSEELSTGHGARETVSAGLLKINNDDAMKKIEEQNTLILSLVKTVNELKSSLFNLQSRAIESDADLKKMKENSLQQNNNFSLEIEELKHALLEMQCSINVPEHVSEEDEAEPVDNQELKEISSNADEVSLDVDDN
ncbi:MAG: hypothetical protein WD512_18410 [Candidatus Paceibacterota bacterium]